MPTDCPIFRDDPFPLSVNLSALSKIEQKRLDLSPDYIGGQIARMFSLRKTKEDNFILYTWNTSKNEICSYAVDHIKGVKVIDYNFTPRYLVELTPKI